MKAPERYSKRKKRKHWLKKKPAYIFFAFAFALICSLAYYHLNSLNQTAFDPTPKAAIIDHLSIQFPNQTFLQTIYAIINQTGLQIDYFPGEQVTVDLYRNLPTHNYKLIIFRVHSTGKSSREGAPPFIVFFTSEEYSNIKYMNEQIDMRLARVNFTGANSPTYFGITPLFIKSSMNGKLNDTIIIAMGCDGLERTTMAEAFIEKGAKAYIGWNGSITTSHTDEATVILLHKLIIEKQTIEQAVKATMKEVGPDPAYQSVLLFYPGEAGSHTIPLTTHDTAINVDVAHFASKKKLSTSNIEI